MRVVIVEDETAAAVNLVSLLRQTFPTSSVPQMEALIRVGPLRSGESS